MDTNVRDNLAFLYAMGFAVPGGAAAFREQCREDERRREEIAQKAAAFMAAYRREHGEQLRLPFLIPWNGFGAP